MSTPSDIVTIGRNIGHTPMGDNEWDDFRANLLRCFDRVDCTIVGTATSSGWGAEETYVVIGECGLFNSDLKHVAWVYGQDAIGVGVIEVVDCVVELRDGNGLRAEEYEL